MNRIFDIALKDLRQILRNRMTFLFLLIMPIAFTLLFGFAFGGSGKTTDARLPVGYLDQDGSTLSQGLKSLLAGSTVIRLDEKTATAADLEAQVSSGKLAAALVVPSGYDRSVRDGAPLKLTFLADPANAASISAESAVTAAEQRLLIAARTAMIVAQTSQDASKFDPAFTEALAAWQDPPVTISTATSAAIKVQDSKVLSMAQSSPSMMLQFAIASLLTAATVIVNERRTRSLQRLLTTATSRVQILLGHFLAIFAMIFIQFTLLIAFGALVLKVDYLRLPLATLLVALASALCVAALGLLIGVFSKTPEHAIMFSLIPMFVLSGLGGAWVPLEYTGAAFQSVGHLSPVAWALDGFKNVAARGLGFNSVLLPSAALLGYALLFFVLAAWRFRTSEER
jgi:ABC-2 type transport system permease protein